jgi:hypothetical protein
VDGLALHAVKSVAASPQQVSLFLAQPEHLEQGPENTESASEAKIHQAIEGRNLEQCILTDLVINDALSIAEGKNGWSYTFSFPCDFMACMWTALCLY